MTPGAPQGARLPRKDQTNARTRSAIADVAFQIGLVLAIERNRLGLNQSELAGLIGGGTEQRHVSRLERGIPAGLSSAQVTRLFKALAMTQFRRQPEFLKWWQQQRA
jgi:hypothetical protein